MSVEKQTRLRSKLEELRQKLREEMEELMKKIEQIDGVILKFLKMKQKTITEEMGRRAQKKK